LEDALRLETGEQESLENRSLAKQNIELRRRLEEDQASYKRKLQAYQEGQQRQAQLVQKLQAKGETSGMGGYLSCDAFAAGASCPVRRTPCDLQGCVQTVEAVLHLSVKIIFFPSPDSTLSPDYLHWPTFCALGLVNLVAQQHQVLTTDASPSEAAV
ncbi:Rootletin, partial [Ophiophagus hannah]